MRVRALRHAAAGPAGLALAVLLPGAAASAEAQQQAAPAAVLDSARAAAPVWLEFAWPVGMAADVDVTRRVTLMGIDADSEVTVHSRFRMTVRDHPRGLAVDRSEARVVRIDDAPNANDARPEIDLDESPPEPGSTYIVSDDGMLLDVEGSPSEDVRAMAAELWASLVWFWAWEEFAPDSVYRFASDAPSPLRPSLSVPVLYEFGSLRRVPCFQGAPAESCVHVEAQVSSEPDAQPAFLRALADSLAAAADGGNAFTLDSYEQESAFSVTLEPASMIPHEFRMRRGFALVTSEGEERAEAGRIDELVLSFHYAPPPD